MVFVKFEHVISSWDVLGETHHRSLALAIRCPLLHRYDIT